MVDTFYIVISAGFGFISGAALVGGIVSQQLGNRLVKVDAEKAQLMKDLRSSKDDSNFWYHQYSDAANERDALLDKYTPLRNSDGTFAKRAA